MVAKTRGKRTNPVFKRRSQRSDKQRQDDVSSYSSARSILKRAVADAEKIAASIKERAKAEAEEEAARIIAQAKEEIEELRKRAETVTAKGDEDTPLAATGEAEIMEVGVGEAPLVEETEGISRIEETTFPGEGDAVSELVEVMAKGLPEEPSLEESPGTEEAEPEMTEKDNNALYIGEIEIVVTRPVSPKLVSKLYNYLQMTPEIKFVQTGGSWDRGTNITVALDKPIPLLSALSSKIPEARVTPERLGKDDIAKGRKVARRIRVVSKES